MNTREIIAACQEYYGMKYTPGMVGMVAKYLDTMSEAVKRHLFVEVLKTHSATFKSLPDIAVFEGCVGRAVEAMRAEAPPVLALAHDEGPLATDEEIADFRRDIEGIVAKWRSR